MSKNFYIIVRIGTKTRSRRSNIDLVIDGTGLVIDGTGNFRYNSQDVEAVCAKMASRWGPTHKYYVVKINLCDDTSSAK